MSQKLLASHLSQQEKNRTVYWEEFDHFIDVRLGWRASTMRHLFHILPGQRILEIGAGNGAFTKALVKATRQECDITAVVFSDESERKAKAALQNLDVRVQSLKDFPGPLHKEKFDYVVAHHLLEDETRDEFLSVVKTLLKPGGGFLLFDPNPWNPYYKLRKMFRKILPLKWRRPAEPISLNRLQVFSVFSKIGYTQINVLPYDFLFPPIPRFLLWSAKNLSLIFENCPYIRNFAGAMCIWARNGEFINDNNPTTDLCEHHMFMGKVSFVIPCHNEEMNIIPLVEGLKDYYGRYIQEIIIVDDNSQDKTEQVAQRLAVQDRRIRVIRRQPPSGVGRALRDGIAAANGDFIMIMDSDFQDIIPEMRDLFDAVVKGADVAVGSRFSRESVLLNYPFTKIIANRFFHVLANLVLRRHFRDISNNLKIMKKEAAKSLRIEYHDFAANAETGLKPLLRGYHVIEVPISWMNRSSNMGLSSFKIMKTGPNYFRLLVRLVWRKIPPPKPPLKKGGGGLYLSMKTLNSIIQFFQRLFRRSDFVFLALFVVSINWIYFKDIFIPRHDGKYTFELFYYFYNHFFTYAKLPQWLPYDTFGLPTNHEQFFGLSAISYLFMVIGWLFRIKDVLLLFKVSILAEHLVLLLGMYLFCRLVFQRRSTVVLICMAAVCSSYWYAQLMFDLRIYYMFPLASYLLVLFFRKQKPEFLWLTGIVSLLGIQGNSMYVHFLWLYIFSLVILVFLIKDRNIWKCLFQRSAANILLFLIFIVLCISIGYQLKDILAFSDVVSRGPEGRNRLGTFLIWGGVHGLPEFLRGLILGFHHDPASPKYIGLLPLVMFGWAVIKERSTIFLAFLTATFALLWFSFGGIFSVISYYFPGMSFYRHIGLVYGLIKILMLICAGFGWEHFCSGRFKNKILTSLLILAVLVFLVDSLRISGQWFHDIIYSEAPLKNLFTALRTDNVFHRMGGYLAAGILTLLLAAFAAFFKKTGSTNDGDAIRGKGIIVFLFLAFLFDMFCYQRIVYQKANRLPSEYQPLLYTMQVNKMPFVMERTQEPQGERQRDAHKLITRPDAGTSYSAAYGFMQYDTCHSDYYIHMHPSGFTRLLKTRNSLDNDLFRVLGCYTPKLRLINQAVYTDSIEETMDVMEGMPELYDTAVLRGVVQEDRLPAAGGKLFPNGQIHIKDFHPDELVLDVDVPGEGAWLIYADSFHPGWQAMINGKQAPIYEAFLAFKAIRLPRGKSHVRFVFHNGLSSVTSYVVALFGLMMSVILAIWLIGELVSCEWLIAA